MSAAKDPRDKRILWYFLAFFGFIICADAIFATIAIRTQTGLVTEQPYQKGLKYNEILDQAKAEKKLVDKVEFKEGGLRWSLSYPDGSPLLDAVVSAHLFRPVQEGHDFDITLQHTGNGQYVASPAFPLKGAWEAQLKASWNTHETYHKTAPLIVE